MKIFIVLVLLLAAFPAASQDKPVAFNLIATVDFSEDVGDGTTVQHKAGEVVNVILGYPDGNGGLKGWTPPPNVKVQQVD